MSRQGGFSLLEVLVAFSIFAISLGIIYQIFSTSLRAGSMTEHYSRAMVIAESKLALVATESPLKEMNDAGEEDGYRWSLDVTRYQEEDPLPNALFAPYVVEVQVVWQEGLAEKSYDLTTLRLGAP